MMHAASACLRTPAGQHIIVSVYHTTLAVKSGRARPISRPRSESDVRTKSGPRRMLYGRRTKKPSRTTQQQYSRRLSVLIQKLAAGWAASAAEIASRNRSQKHVREATASVQIQY